MYYVHIQFVLCIVLSISFLSTDGMIYGDGFSTTHISTYVTSTRTTGTSLVQAHHVREYPESIVGEL